MAIRVRVKNVQSIKDAEVIIDGLTVVTGTNNSGKTALMRAIQGVFTNPPAGPLLRWGEAFLSVEIRFEDGTTVLWEKGWEKPDQKGMAINRYKLNGQEIPLAGRGAPAEIAALGVRDIQAGTDVLWPQLAQQFEGVLFLVNRPGSATAEALSDVDKVGVLTNALRDSEKDRRTAESELKLRRQDVTSWKDRVRKFEGLPRVRLDADSLKKGLDEAASTNEAVVQARKALEDFRLANARLAPLKSFNLQSPSIEEVRQKNASWVETSGLNGRLGEAKARFLRLKDFNTATPEVEPIQQLLRDFRASKVLLDKLDVVHSDLAKLGSFSVDAPQVGDLNQKLALFRELQNLARRLSLLRGKAESLKFPGYSFVESERASRLSLVVQQVHTLRNRLDLARGLLRKESELQEEAEGSLEEAKAEVAQLLKDSGVCPTCQTPHSSEHIHLGLS